MTTETKFARRCVWRYSPRSRRFPSVIRRSPALPVESAPATTLPAAKNDVPHASLVVYPPDIHLNTKLAPATVHRRGDSARRRDAGRDEASRREPGRSEAGPSRRRDAVSGGRWPNDAQAIKYMGQELTVPVDGQKRRRRSADQLQAGRDAGVHAGRLQHGQLPRRGPRQRRLLHLAVRLRSGRRLLPADARNRLPPHQSGPAARKPAAGKERSARAAHRRQAVRQARANITTRFCAGSRPACRNDPAEPPACVKVELFPAQCRARRRRRHAAVHRPRDLLRRHRSRRDESGRVPDQQRQFGADHPDGLVTAGDRGEAFVMARFDTHTVGSQVLVLPKDLKYTPAPVSRATTSTSWCRRSCNKIRVEPSGICSDEDVPAPRDDRHHRPVAHRGRISDVPGRSAAGQAGEAGRSAAGAQGVFGNLGHEVGRVADGQDRATTSATRPCYCIATWLTDQICQQRAARQDGPRAAVAPAAARSRTRRRTITRSNATRSKTAENMAQVFMGIRTQCCQCHNHPFDRWTMNDYYSFAAFFAQVGRKQGEDYRETIIFNRGGGEVTHPVTGQVMAPKFLGGAGARRGRQGSPRGAGQVAHLAGESVFRHQHRQPRLGAFLRHAASSSRSTTSASAIRPAIPSCSRRWARS